MRLFERWALWRSACYAVASAARSHGAVILSIAPTSTSAVAGGTFNLTVSFTATRTTPLDSTTFFDRPPPGFSQSRPVRSGAPTRPYKHDPTVLGLPSASLINARVSGPSTITGSNGSDLGATSSSEILPGTYVVATYTLSVSAAALPGSYTILTYNDPNKGWGGGSADDLQFVQF